MEEKGKYQKLASEYSKLRAQASVLKKAVLEEQAKGTGLRAQLRRAEQEKDSLGFRNKQLEHRVTVLQDEIATCEGRKCDKDSKRKAVLGRTQTDKEERATGNGSDISQDTLIFEELQKKIMENARLTLLIEEKETDLKLHTERISNLEQMLHIRIREQSDLEKQLQRDLVVMQGKNSELENKLSEAASIIGSEDALSVSGSENTPILNLQHNHAYQASSTYGHSNEDRISLLEKEVLHWRTQYEISKLNDAVGGNKNSDNQSNVDLVQDIINIRCSSTAAAGISVKPSLAESKSGQFSRESFQETPEPLTKETLLYNNFSKKFEDLIRAKCMAESHVFSYEKEAEHLQNCLENATHELKTKDDQLQSINQALRVLEDELATTRFNYEEQISVLTEQLINLSEQLAACKI